MTVDRAIMIEKFSKFKLVGNEQGLIPTLNVYMQQLPNDFWNGFSRRLVNYVPDDLIEVVEGLLRNAAQESGYHTGYGIMMSEEWKTLGATMIRKVEDVLHGAYAIFTAWGWAKAEIIDIEPKKRMVVRAYDYYESDILSYGLTLRPCAYMVQGVSAAFMDLTYGKPYPNGLGTYTCTQIKGIEVGDDYGEFIVTKA